MSPARGVSDHDIRLPQERAIDLLAQSGHQAGARTVAANASRRAITAACAASAPGIGDDHVAFYRRECRRELLDVSAHLTGLEGDRMEGHQQRRAPQRQADPSRQFRASAWPVVA